MITLERRSYRVKCSSTKDQDEIKLAINIKKLISREGFGGVKD